MTVPSLLIPALLAFSLVATAQDATGSRAGLIDRSEGDAGLDNRAHPGVRPEWRVIAGRARVILGPGVVLDVRENSIARLLDNRASRPYVELPSGSFRLELSGQPAPSCLSLVLGDALVTIATPGEYEFDAERRKLTVLRGRARVSAGGNGLLVRQGQVMVAHEGLHVTAARHVTARY